MAAAADALGVAQPTIWKQIRSLETHLGMPVLEPHARGCRLTAAGEVLFKLVAPLVAEIETVPDRFKDSLGQQSRRLVIAATPRPFDEEIFPCVAEYERRFPHVRLVLSQVATRESVIKAVETGEADLGLASLRQGAFSEYLRCEPVYELEPVLLVPKEHPLAGNSVTLRDFSKYPILNARGLYADWGVSAALDEVGAFAHPQRRIELEMARSIRHYVNQRMGIGIVVRPAGAPPLDDLVELPLSGVFHTRMIMFAFYRQRVTPDPELLDFIQVVRDTFSKQFQNSAHKINPSNE
jgi:DNA-binding transcriptional LysR family regulator